MNNILESDLANEFIRKSKNKELDVYGFGEENLSELLTDIILYTAVNGVESEMSNVTYILNVLMDNLDYVSISLQNQLLFFDIIKNYDKLPFIIKRADSLMVNRRVYR